MVLLGPTLAEMRHALPDERFTLLTSVRLGYHSFCCVQSIHQHGLLRRDRKPPSVLIDFGLSRTWRRQDGSPIRPRRGVGLVGTRRYASVHAHQAVESSHRDDLISWVYTVLEPIEETLPWSGKENKEVLRERKPIIPPEKVCLSTLHPFVGMASPFTHSDSMRRLTARELKERFRRLSKNNAKGGSGG
jgi:casein kinase 1/casein kinase 1 delta